jgi:hypothetical protein
MAQKKAEKTCFVVSPIGKDGSPTRIRANKFQKYVVERVLLPRDYKVERADQLGEPGLITNQIVKRIVECDLLVADLTDHNANVFYELAIRHGLKKPFIHFIAHDQNIPFDNLNVRAIPVDLTDLDSVEDACNQFELQVSAIEGPDHRPESPISVAFDLESLRSSGRSDDAVMLQVLEQLSSLHHEVRRLQTERVVGKGIQRNSRRITSPGDLVLTLKRNGFSDLGDYILYNITVTKIEFPNVVVTSDAGRAARDISGELSHALKEITGEPWEVTFLPF